MWLQKWPKTMLIFFFFLNPQWFYPIILNDAPYQAVESDATAKEC